MGLHRRAGVAEVGWAVASSAWGGRSGMEDLVLGAEDSAWRDGAAWGGAERRPLSDLCVCCLRQLQKTATTGGLRWAMHDEVWPASRAPLDGPALTVG